MSIPTEQTSSRPVEAWFEWTSPGEAYTVGAEEELMLVHPPGWALAQTVETVLPSLAPHLAERVQGETHGSALEIGSRPFAVWHDTIVSSGERYQAVYGSMRELARREPTFALHVHVGVPDPEDAIALMNRMRTHLPLLLALSANSPFWQGRDSGLASARTPLFQAFPRVGIPRVFNDYDDYVDAVDLLVRCGSIPDPTFLWWDVRPQPRL